MKDKIIEILKELSIIAEDDGLKIHLVSGFKFAEAAERIESLYSPEISEGEIDVMAKEKWMLGDDEMPQSVGEVASFKRGFKAALSKVKPRKVLVIEICECKNSEIIKSDNGIYWCKTCGKYPVITA